LSSFASYCYVVCEIAEQPLDLEASDWAARVYKTAIQRTTNVFSAMVLGGNEEEKAALELQDRLMQGGQAMARVRDALAPRSWVGRADTRRLAKEMRYAQLTMMKGHARLRNAIVGLGIVAHEWHTCWGCSGLFLAYTHRTAFPACSCSATRWLLALGWLLNLQGQSNSAPPLEESSVHRRKL
jgi:hypothetical protein